MYVYVVQVSPIEFTTIVSCRGETIISKCRLMESIKIWIWSGRICRYTWNNLQVQVAVDENMAKSCKWNIARQHDGDSEWIWLGWGLRKRKDEALRAKSADGVSTWGAPCGKDPACRHLPSEGPNEMFFTWDGKRITTCYYLCYIINCAVIQM